MLNSVSIDYCFAFEEVVEPLLTEFAAEARPLDPAQRHFHAEGEPAVDVDEAGLDFVGAAGGRRHIRREDAGHEAVLAVVGSFDYFVDRGEFKHG